MAERQSRLSFIWRAVLHFYFDLDFISTPPLPSLTFGSPILAISVCLYLYFLRVVMKGLVRVVVRNGSRYVRSWVYKPFISAYAHNDHKLLLLDTTAWMSKVASVEVRTVLLASCILIC